MDKKEILRLLRNDPDLFARAGETLSAHKGSKVFIRGLIEFSNICRRNCRYCGLRAQNKKARRYRMSQEEVLECATKAVQAGVDTIVLQSGEGSCAREWLGEIVREIKNRLHVPVTLSVGECPGADYEYWRLRGADRYLLKHETADARLYALMHPGYTLADRLECLKNLKDLGYETGGGFMIGLPGQTLETLADDIALCAALDLDMCGAGPFIAQQDTPLCLEANGSTQLTLKTLAVLRLVLPDANLPATTALASLDTENGQIKGLRAGANVLMPSFTPAKYSASYAIYDNKHSVAMREAYEVIRGAGRSI